MLKQTSYTSKIQQPDGSFFYDEEETSVWRDLYMRQMENLQDFACESYLAGQKKLGFSSDEIPQVAALDARLHDLTKAGVAPVAALIPEDEFATLLKNRKFPVATFIRRREHIDYIEEPDIFHEVFGHSPMLTNLNFCRFMERFGTLSLEVSEEERKYLFRLFWFTVEFGLIREDGKLKAFGAGIISSPSETENAAGDKVKTLPFDALAAMRTPYRIDIVQPLYFVIDSFESLAASLDGDPRALIKKARELGDFPPRFEVAA